MSIENEFVAGRGYTRKDWEEVSESPDFTAADLERARPFTELHPGEIKVVHPTRGRPKSHNPKQAISIRLDADVLAKFKATGAGWQTRINDVLRSAEI